MLQHEINLHHRNYPHIVELVPILVYRRTVITHRVKRPGSAEHENSSAEEYKHDSGVHRSS